VTEPKKKIKIKYRIPQNLNFAGIGVRPNSAKYRKILWSSMSDLFFFVSSLRAVFNTYLPVTYPEKFEKIPEEFLILKPPAG
jgi:hypothetical protein